jgi:hypothetical protein
MIPDHQALRGKDPRSASLVEVPATPAPSKDSSERLEWLFRESVRRQVIHPLLGRVRAYRAGEAP